MEKKMKHLDFLQLVITRMNANSFLLKGWAVTLLIALFALDISKANMNFIKITLIPIFLFWMLDGYFLYQERLFRDLYDEIRKRKEEDIDFSMKRKSSFLDYLDATFSKTLSLFYGAMLIVVVYFLSVGGF